MLVGAVGLSVPSIFLGPDPLVIIPPQPPFPIILHHLLLQSLHFVGVLALLRDQLCIPCLSDTSPRIQISPHKVGTDNESLDST